MYLGELTEDGTHDLKFTTVDSTGLPVTLSGTPVISCYKDNGTTQTTAGITLTVDFDTVTGLNNVRLVLTDAFYVAAADYQLVITTGTVDGVSVVGTVIANFSIANRTEDLVDAVWDEVLTGAAHNVASSAGRRLRTLQDFGVYEGGSVWIDTVNGTAGTTDFENGTVTNPVDSIADALTLAGSVGLRMFHVLPASSITLAASASNYEFVGQSYSMALGGQSIAGAFIFHCVSLSGIGTGTNGLPWIIQETQVGTCTLAAYGFMEKCALSDTLTLSSTAGVSADIITVIDCSSAVAGGGSPSIDASGVTKTTSINVRNWSGGLALTLNSNCTVSVDVNSGGTITVNGTGGSINIRGIVEGVTDNSGGSVTITQNATLNRDFVNAECDTAISDASLATAASIAALNDVSANDILTTQMTEDYAADGVAPTLAQALFAIMQQAGEFAITGTTITVKKLDGSTSAMTFTLDDATNPTSRTRAT